MNKILLTALSLTAAALACRTALSPPTQARVLLPSRAQDPLRSTSDEDGLGTANATDMNPRITPVVKAVQQTQDSVVSIYIVHEQQGRRGDTTMVDGQGSGVVLDEAGLVITNWHVVQPAIDARSPFRVLVRFGGGGGYMGKVLSSSPEHDLALVQLELEAGDKVKPIILGDSSTLMIGEPTIAIGNPRGNANSVTVGVLSAIDRSIQVQTPDGRVRPYTGLLQTDAAINQGNSGGALLDATGKLIGINNAMAVGAENIGFAIPVNTVKRVFQDVLLSSENLANVWLGMRVVDENGVAIVGEVDPRGPAAQVGVRAGDRVVTANGAPVRTALDYARRVLDARPGQAFPLLLQRADRRNDVQPVPMSNAEYELLRRVGLRVEVVSARDDADLVRRATREFYADSGRRQVSLLPAILRVTDVEAEGPAGSLKIERGDLLLGIVTDSLWGRRTMALPSADNLADALRQYAGHHATLVIQRGDQGYLGDVFVRPF